MDELGINRGFSPHFSPSRNLSCSENHAQLYINFPNHGFRMVRIDIRHYSENPCNLKIIADKNWWGGRCQINHLQLGWVDVQRGWRQSESAILCIAIATYNIERDFMVAFEWVVCRITSSYYWCTLYFSDTNTSSHRLHLERIMLEYQLSQLRQIIADDKRPQSTRL